MRLIFSLILAATLSGCATYENMAPKIQSSTPPMMFGVHLKNGNTETYERIFFSDGITTLTGMYSDWSNYLISKYASAYDGNQENRRKHLEISVTSIACSGSFLTNCYVSVSVATGGGEKVEFNSENVYGYGAIPTASKALDQVAKNMQTSQQLNKYIYER